MSVAGASIPALDRLLLPAEIRDQIIAHVTEGLPEEACGLLAFEGEHPVRLYPGTNVLASATRYRMKDVEVVRAIEDMDSHGWWLGAIYHSHPSSPAVPSDTDLDEANWPRAIMLIVSLAASEPELRAYRIIGDRRGFTEIEIVAVEEPGPEQTRGLGESVRSFFRRLVPVPAVPMLRPIASGAASASDALPPARSVIGVLGGMGPAATGDLFLKIVSETPAEADQDHIPVVVYSDPRVPDRTEALLYGGEDPVPWLVRGARQLERMGASFIVIPCNTAHAFLNRVEPEIGIPVLSMIDATAESISAQFPNARRVGLLATTGTIRAGIYQEALRRRGFEAIVPDDERQEHCVMPAIRAVKASHRHESVTSRLVEAAESLEQRGAHLILAACTEIPLALAPGDLHVPLVDATAELAKAAVREALERDLRNAAVSAGVTPESTGLGIR
jgi:aspartate racemase